MDSALTTRPRPLSKPFEDLDSAGQHLCRGCASHGGARPFWAYPLSQQIWLLSGHHLPHAPGRGADAVLRRAVLHAPARAHAAVRRLHGHPARRRHRACGRGGWRQRCFGTRIRGRAEPASGALHGDARYQAESGTALPAPWTNMYAEGDVGSPLHGCHCTDMTAPRRGWRGHHGHGRGQGPAAPLYGLYPHLPVSPRLGGRGHPLLVEGPGVSGLDAGGNARGALPRAMAGGRREPLADGGRTETVHSVPGRITAHLARGAN